MHQNQQVILSLLFYQATHEGRIYYKNRVALRFRVRCLGLYSTLREVTLQCNTLRKVVRHCATLQDVTLQYKTLRYNARRHAKLLDVVRHCAIRFDTYYAMCKTLHYAVRHCNMLQYVTLRCQITSCIARPCIPNFLFNSNSARSHMLTMLYECKMFIKPWSHVNIPAIFMPH